MFAWRNKRNILLLVWKKILFQVIVQISSPLLTFIDHKSKMTQTDSLVFHFLTTCRLN